MNDRVPKGDSWQALLSATDIDSIRKAYRSEKGGGRLQRGLEDAVTILSEGYEHEEGLRECLVDGVSRALPFHLVLTNRNLNQTNRLDWDVLRDARNIYNFAVAKDLGIEFAGNRRRRAKEKVNQFYEGVSRMSDRIEDTNWAKSMTTWRLHTIGMWGKDVGFGDGSRELLEQCQEHVGSEAAQTVMDAFMAGESFSWVLTRPGIPELVAQDQDIWLKAAKRYDLAMAMASTLPDELFRAMRSPDGSHGGAVDLPYPAVEAIMEEHGLGIRGTDTREAFDEVRMAATSAAQSLTEALAESVAGAFDDPDGVASDLFRMAAQGQPTGFDSLLGGSDVDLHRLGEDDAVRSVLADGRKTWEAIRRYTDISRFPVTSWHGISDGELDAMGRSVSASHRVAWDTDVPEFLDEVVALLSDRNEHEVKEIVDKAMGASGSFESILVQVGAEGATGDRIVEARNMYHAALASAAGLLAEVEVRVEHGGSETARPDVGPATDSDWGRGMTADRLRQIGGTLSDLQEFKHNSQHLLSESKKLIGDTVGAGTSVDDAFEAGSDFSWIKVQSHVWEGVLNEEPDWHEAERLYDAAMAARFGLAADLYGIISPVSNEWDAELADEAIEEFCQYHGLGVRDGSSRLQEKRTDALAVRDVLFEHLGFELRDFLEQNGFEILENYYDYDVENEANPNAAEVKIAKATEALRTQLAQAGHTSTMEQILPELIGDAAESLVSDPHLIIRGNDLLYAIADYHRIGTFPTESCHDVSASDLDAVVVLITEIGGSVRRDHLNETIDALAKVTGDRKQADLLVNDFYKQLGSFNDLLSQIAVAPDTDLEAARVNYNAALIGELYMLPTLLDHHEHVRDAMQSADGSTLSAVEALKAIVDGRFPIPGAEVVEDLRTESGLSPAELLERADELIGTDNPEFAGITERLSRWVDQYEAREPRDRVPVDERLREVRAVLSQYNELAWIQSLPPAYDEPTTNNSVEDRTMTESKDEQLPRASGWVRDITTENLQRVGDAIEKGGWWREGVDGVAEERSLALASIPSARRELVAALGGREEDIDAALTSAVETRDSFDDVLERLDLDATYQGEDYDSTLEARLHYDIAMSARLGLVGWIVPLVGRDDTIDELFGLIQELPAGLGSVEDIRTASGLSPFALVERFSELHGDDEREDVGAGFNFDNLNYWVADHDPAEWTSGGLAPDRRYEEVKTAIEAYDAWAIGAAERQERREQDKIEHLEETAAVILCDVSWRQAITASALVDAGAALTRLGAEHPEGFYLEAAIDGLTEALMADLGEYAREGIYPPDGDVAEAVDHVQVVFPRLLRDAFEDGLSFDVVRLAPVVAESAAQHPLEWSTAEDAYNAGQAVRHGVGTQITTGRILDAMSSMGTEQLTVEEARAAVAFREIAQRGYGALRTLISIHLDGLDAIEGDGLDRFDRMNAIEEAARDGEMEVPGLEPQTQEAISTLFNSLRWMAQKTRDDIQPDSGWARDVTIEDLREVGQSVKDGGWWIEGVDGAAHERTFARRAIASARLELIDALGGREEDIDAALMIADVTQDSFYGVLEHLGINATYEDYDRTADARRQYDLAMVARFGLVGQLAASVGPDSTAAILENVSSVLEGFHGIDSVQLAEMSKHGRWDETVSAERLTRVSPFLESEDLLAGRDALLTIMVDIVDHVTDRTATDEVRALCEACVDHELSFESVRERALVLMGDDVAGVDVLLDGLDRASAAYDSLMLERRGLRDHVLDISAERRTSHDGLVRALEGELPLAFVSRIDDRQEIADLVAHDVAVMAHRATAAGMTVLEGNPLLLSDGPGALRFDHIEGLGAVGSSTEPVSELAELGITWTATPEVLQGIRSSTLTETLDGELLSEVSRYFTDEEQWDASVDSDVEVCGHLLEGMLEREYGQEELAEIMRSYIENQQPFADLLEDLQIDRAAEPAESRESARIGEAETIYYGAILKETRLDEPVRAIRSGVDGITVDASTQGLSAEELSMIVESGEGWSEVVLFDELLEIAEAQRQAEKERAVPPDTGSPHRSFHEKRAFAVAGRSQRARFAITEGDTVMSDAEQERADSFLKGGGTPMTLDEISGSARGIFRHHEVFEASLVGGVLNYNLFEAMVEDCRADAVILDSERLEGLRDDYNATMLFRANGNRLENAHQEFADSLSDELIAEFESRTIANGAEDVGAAFSQAGYSRPEMIEKLATYAAEEGMPGKEFIRLSRTFGEFSAEDRIFEAVVTYGAFAAQTIGLIEETALARAEVWSADKETPEGLLDTLEAVLSHGGGTASDAALSVLRYGMVAKDEAEGYSADQFLADLGAAGVPALSEAQEGVVRECWDALAPSQGGPTDWVSELEGHVIDQKADGPTVRDVIKASLRTAATFRALMRTLRATATVPGIEDIAAIREGYNSWRSEVLEVTSQKLEAARLAAQEVQEGVGVQAPELTQEAGQELAADEVLESKWLEKVGRAPGKQAEVAA